jgi:hypothetical protein
MKQRKGVKEHGESLHDVYFMTMEHLSAVRKIMTQ